MFTFLLKFYQNRFLSRWTVLFLDLFATLLALIIAIAFRFSFQYDEAQRVLNFYSFTGVLSIYLVAYLYVGSHKGILRHTSVADVKNVFRASMIGGLVCTIFSFGFSVLFELRLFPISIIAFHFSITFIALVGIRLAAKSVYIAGTHKHDKQIRAIIFGCGDSGIMTKMPYSKNKKEGIKS
jgi:FlaA1/EpsC-like NDP-sugar epimerase